MLKLTPIPAFNDNYIWCVHSEDTLKAIVVDPGCARSVSEFCQEKELELAAILLTHHHPDHTGGIATLTKDSSVTVYGFQNATFPNVDHKYAEGDAFELLGTQFQIIEVPGHTLDHIAFYSPVDSEHDTPWLFCGDTLFSGGCGRLFEGTPAQMFDSLGKLKELPEETLVCCAHEYTLANLEFAKGLSPKNEDLNQYMAWCTKQRNNALPTVPSTIAIERTINPFLREMDPEIRQSIRSKFPHTAEDPVEIWAAIRKAKDMA